MNYLERIAHWRDAWEAAPKSLRALFVTLHDTHEVCRDNPVIYCQHTLDNGKVLRTYHPTEPELAWLRSRVLVDPARGLQIAEQAREVYARIPTQYAVGKTKTSFAGIGIKLCGAPSWIDGVVVSTEMALPPRVSTIDRSDRTSVMDRLLEASEIWWERSKEPDPHAPQIDLLRSSPFDPGYLGLSLNYDLGVVLLDVYIPPKCWEDLP